jgi:hypothetical protein
MITGPHDKEFVYYCFSTDDKPEGVIGNSVLYVIDLVTLNAIKYRYNGYEWVKDCSGGEGSGINAGTDGGSLGLTYDFSDYDGTDPIYIGSLGSDGSWIIQAYAVSLKQMRYCAGASGYATNWTNRASLTYVLRNEL